MYESVNERCVPCEAPQPPAGVCRGMDQNKEIMFELREMAHQLRAVIGGPIPTGDCANRKPPECLMDAVTEQRDILVEIRAELSIALENMNR